MSRSKPSRNEKQRTPTDAPYQEIPEADRHYIGQSKPEVEYSTGKPLHWYQAYLLGYRPTEWPKRNDDADDDRYNLIEKEIQ